MMNRVAAIIVATLAPAADAQIKVGGLTHGSIGGRGQAAVELWASTTHVGFTVETKFVAYNSSNVAANLQELTDWGMNVLMTPYGSGDTTTTLNAIPDGTKMPILVWGGASDSIFSTEGPCQTKSLHCFGGFTTASKYMEPSLEAVVAKFGAVSVYSLTNANGFSRSVTTGAKSFIESHANLTLAGEAEISVKSAALTDADKALVQTAIAATPDVFMISGHAGDVEEVVGLIKAGFTSTYVPKAIIATNGLTTPSNYDPATGVEGVIMPDQWNDMSDMADTVVKWTSAAFKSAMETKNEPGSYHAASAGALAVMLSHAAAAVTGDITGEALATSLVGLGATDTFYGTMDWNADGSLMDLKPMYGKQHQVDAVQIVAPVAMQTEPIMELPTPAPAPAPTTPSGNATDATPTPPSADVSGCGKLNPIWIPAFFSMLANTRL